MTYGAKESNPKEGIGLLLLVVGISAIAAGWAYAGGIMQPVAMLLGVAAFAASFAVLNMAKNEA